MEEAMGDLAAVMYTFRVNPSSIAGRPDVRTQLVKIKQAISRRYPGMTEHNTIMYNQLETVAEAWMGYVHTRKIIPRLLFGAPRAPRLDDTLNASKAFVKHLTSMYGSDSLPVSAWERWIRCITTDSFLQGICIQEGKTFGRALDITELKGEEDVGDIFFEPVNVLVQASLKGTPFAAYKAFSTATRDPDGWGEIGLMLANAIEDVKRTKSKKSLTEHMGWDMEEEDEVHEAINNLGEVLVHGGDVEIAMDDLTSVLHYNFVDANGNVEQINIKLPKTFRGLKSKGKKALRKVRGAGRVVRRRGRAAVGAKDIARKFRRLTSADRKFTTKNVFLPSSFRSGPTRLYAYGQVRDLQTYKLLSSGGMDKFKIRGPAVMEINIGGLSGKTLQLSSGEDDLDNDIGAPLVYTATSGKILGTMYEWWVRKENVFRNSHNQIFLVTADILIGAFPAVDSDKFNPETQSRRIFDIVMIPQFTIKEDFRGQLKLSAGNITKSKKVEFELKDDDSRNFLRFLFLAVPTTPSTDKKTLKTENVTYTLERIRFFMGNRD